MELELRVSLEDIFQGAMKAEKIERQRYDKFGVEFVETKVLTIKCDPTWVMGTKLRYKTIGNTAGTKV
jgi:hypothetical protein